MNRNILYVLFVALAGFCVLGVLVATGSIESPLRALTGTGDSDSEVACTREARVCADGSVVSRTGSTCEFTACPSTVKDLMPTSTPADEALPAETDTPEPALPPPPVDSGRMCTMDAKQCPDGSYVGRTGPNCEFVCPTTPSRGTISVTGIVTVGPMCPVSQSQAEDSCMDAPYQGQITLTNTATGDSYTATTDASGTFTLTLTRGVYDVSRPNGSGPFPACGGKIEIVSPGAPVPISCDSGIR